jgi:hypothetical protein
MTARLMIDGTSCDEAQQHHGSNARERGAGDADGKRGAGAHIGSRLRAAPTSEHDSTTISSMPMTAGVVGVGP